MRGNSNRLPPFLSLKVQLLVRWSGVHSRSTAPLVSSSQVKRRLPNSSDSGAIRESIRSAVKRLGRVAQPGLEMAIFSATNLIRHGAK